ncbi:DUF2510 domain-containing protein [Agreia sp. PsM10]|uniref:DUF2510 domain-containing protein n=1 Tax=Agreia sp. PsM10 TaxID=3030533 RepID=UPI00263AA513|nr:DUF2510 domain-containing protein [Agreia sp. PsM10]MDN4642015.1 DUF2510 domain-containing protein [Agreia sp. PsM10]
MTNPYDYSGQTQPAGWYPDPSGGQGTRWWDGQQWTQHVSDPALQVYASNEPRRVDPSTPLYTPWIWLIVLLPLLSIVELLFWDMDAYMASSISATRDPLAQYSDPGYLLIQGSSWLFYAVTVLFAFLDRRVLLQRGFDRPFHWAWTFLGSTVYIIGRSVIVRRRSGRGLLPIWVTIGVFVVSLVVAIVKISSAVSVMTTLLPQLR